MKCIIWDTQINKMISGVDAYVDEDGDVYVYCEHQNGYGTMEYRPYFKVLDVKTQKDGVAWCATLPDFVNLQESISGWGVTPTRALDDLLSKISEESAK